MKSYAAWIKERQTRLEGHQARVWASDPLHQRMTKTTERATESVN